MYVEERASSNEEMLFSGLKPIVGSWGAYATKWFIKYKSDFGHLPNSGKDFHSFRHTFEVQTGDKAIEDYVIKGLMGHSTKDQTHSRYGQINKAKRILPIYEKVGFKDLIPNVVPWHHKTK